jgi:hypothetical protein
LPPVPAPTPAEVAERIAHESAFLRDVRREVEGVIVGQKALIDGLLIGLLADGHVLLEGLPGLAKSLAVQTLAQALGGTFRRIQFTPDLLPSDLVGTQVYDPKTGAWNVREGPVFANFVLARRDQPRPGQGAVGPARGHAGAPGEPGRRDAPAARAVPGVGHAEPGRARGHLPAARGPDRPLPAQGGGGLPRARGREDDRAAHVGHLGPAPGRGHAAQVSPRARCSTRCTWTSACSTTS